MKKYISSFFLLSSLLLLILATSTPLGAEEPKRKIIVFDDRVLNEPARESLLARFGAVKVKNLDLIGGSVILLPSSSHAALARQKGVLRVDDDVIVTALGKVSSPNQIIPWGIERIKAPTIWGSTTADIIKVGVVDTGIYLTHPDLQTNIKGNFNAINSTKTGNDDNGHGTHVAGIIGALNNTIGVVGAGPDIDLYAIKVLGRNGSGWLSDIIEGLDWAVQNNMQVINMSLGTASNVQSFHDAIKRVNAAGIVQVAAAGNNSGAVNYPAAYPEVIAVSATDGNDVIASFSSRGEEVDLAAPGVNIYSTYKTSYANLSGTSMASPHVAGVAALLLSTSSKCDTDANGTCSPAEVQQRLEATAHDLGATGKDTLYGSGLVDAFAALQ